MNESGRQKIFEKCEARGISWARSITLASGDPDGWEAKQVTLEWIDEYERKERSTIEFKQLALAERSTAAAETSSTAASESAKTSGTSARAALFAAVVSFFALIVSVAAYMKA